jgi:serine/threonine protein kinase
LAYFLLTGTPVFNGTSVVEICMKHTQDVPERPSSRLGKPMTPKLEELILRCLSKSPQDRPANASALLRELHACGIQGVWTSDDAAVWWNQRPSEALPVPSAPDAGTPAGAQPDVDTTLVLARDPPHG